MKKFIVVGAGAAISAAATSAVLLGAGVAAAAPDVTGETYADAVEAIEGGGATPKVVMRVGSRLPLDDCIVTNARDESAFRPAQDGIYGYAEDEVMLSLNCDGDHATATNPGASVASPAGRAAKAAADEAAAEEAAAAEQAAAAEEAALAEVSTPDR